MPTGYRLDPDGVPFWIKHPDALKDYTLDFADPEDSWLDVDTLVAAEFQADPGLTIVAESRTATTATVELSGGEAGRTYRVTCTIDTAQGRRDVFTVRVKVFAPAQSVAGTC